jgi:hypothetical protein
MSAPSRRLAVACVALFAFTATGCIISRPCNWDEWRYQSSDGRYRGDNWQGSPPLELDQQARMNRRPRNGEEASTSQLAENAEKPHAKPQVVKNRIPPAVEPVQWQEPEKKPALAKKSEPRRQPAAPERDAKPRPAKRTKSAAPSEPQQPQIAGPADRTPYNWGFFGAETRW